MVLRTSYLVAAAIAATQLSTLSAYHVSPDKLTNDKDGLPPTVKDTVNLHIFREHATGFFSDNLFHRKLRVDPTQLHDVIFVIQQNNIEKLTEILDDISDPTSTNYGKHMTGAEIADLTGNPVARDEVVSYLLSAGASIVSETLYGEYITASAPVSVWEEVLDTEFFAYSLPSRSDEERNYIRAEKYSVPIFLHPHVESVFNTIQMPSTQALSPEEFPPTPSKKFHPQLQIDPTSSSVIKIPSSIITRFMKPWMLNEEYNIDSNLGHPLATQAVLGLSQQYFCPQDLNAFQTAFNLPMQPLQSSIGGHIATTKNCSSNQSICGLSNMNIQYMIAMSRSPTTYYHTDLGLSAWLLEVSSTSNPPRVISISYLLDESDITVSEFEAFNTQAIKLGLMGVTLLAAAGDDGANSWRVRTDKTKCGYSPQFPASSPYVVSVGATQVIY